jgi:2-isopropylmalate synthase
MLDSSTTLVITHCYVKHACLQEDGYVPVICGMGRTVFKDLERTWEAVRHAQRPRVHMVLATSEIHMKHKLHMTRDQVSSSSIK